jgi:tripartite-type tricarboxylate transporter receptor subunit TctC
MSRRHRSREAPQHVPPGRPKASGGKKQPKEESVVLFNLKRALAVAAFALLVAAPARAADFAGKTVEFVIPFAVGGGSDVWARFFAPILSERLPGKPTVVVKNVPGGGSITGTNQFQQRARPDGLTILGTSGSTQFPYLLDDPRVKYEYRDWIPVLASPTGGVVYVNPDLGARDARDIAKLKGKDMKYGSQGATSLDLVALLAFEILELDVKPVFGMKGRGDGRLAYERGEAAIDYQTTPAYVRNVAPLVKLGKAVPLFTWGVLDDKGEFVRDPSFPDIPHFIEAYRLAYGKAPSGTAFEAFKAFNTAGFAVQKLIVLPKGTPKDVVDAYVAAIAAAVAAPGFKEKAGEEIGEYAQATGAASARMLKVALDIDPAAKAWVKKWLLDKYNAKLGD